MTEAHTFNCPKCGAALTASGDQAEMRCQYCGNTVIVPEELRAAHAEQEMAAESAQAAGAFAKFIALIVGGSFALPILISAMTLCIILIVFIFVGQMISSAFAPFSNSAQPAAPVAIATAASQIIDVPSPTRAVGPTAAPTSTPFPTPLPAATPTPFTNVILKDDFSNPSSGWDRKNSSDYILDYVQGGYRVFIGKTNGGELLWIKDGYTDVSIEADAKRIAGPDDAWFGVACRLKEGAGGYAFEISMDGNYAIDKYTFTSSGDKQARLTKGTLKPNVLKAGDNNHIRAACDGSTLALFVNEQFVGLTSDRDFTSGGVGLAALAGPSGKSGTDMLFSNFVVKGP